MANSNLEQPSNLLNITEHVDTIEDNNNNNQIQVGGGEVEEQDNLNNLEQQQQPEKKFCLDDGNVQLQKEEEVIKVLGSEELHSPKSAKDDKQLATDENKINIIQAPAAAERKDEKDAEIEKLKQAIQKMKSEFEMKNENNQKRIGNLQNQIKLQLQGKELTKSQTFTNSNQRQLNSVIVPPTSQLSPLKKEKEILKYGQTIISDSKEEDDDEEEEEQEEEFEEMQTGGVMNASADKNKHISNKKKARNFLNKQATFSHMRGATSLVYGRTQKDWKNYERTSVVCNNVIKKNLQNNQQSTENLPTEQLLNKEEKQDQQQQKEQIQEDEGISSQKNVEEEQEGQMGDMELQQRRSSGILKRLNSEEIREQDQREYHKIVTERRSNSKKAENSNEIVAITNEKEDEKNNKQGMSEKLQKNENQTYKKLFDKQTINLLKQKVKNNQYLDQKDFFNLKNNIFFLKYAQKNHIIQDMKVIFSDKGYMHNPKGNKRKECLLVINFKQILFFNPDAYKQVSPAIDIECIDQLILSETSQTLTLLKVVVDEEEQKQGSSKAAKISKIQPMKAGDDKQKIKKLKDEKVKLSYISVENFKRQELISFLANIYKQTQKKTLPIEYALPPQFQQLQQHGEQIVSKAQLQNSQNNIISPQKQQRETESQKKNRHKMEQQMLQNQMFNTVKMLGFLKKRNKSTSFFEKIVTEKWSNVFVVLSEIGFLCFKSPSDRECKVIPLTSYSNVIRVPSNQEKAFCFTIIENPLSADQPPQNIAASLNFADLNQIKGEIFAAISQSNLDQWMAAIEQYQEHKFEKEQKLLNTEIQQISTVEGNLLNL